MGSGLCNVLPNKLRKPNPYHKPTHPHGQKLRLGHVPAKHCTNVGKRPETQDSVPLRVLAPEPVGRPGKKHRSEGAVISICDMDMDMGVFLGGAPLSWVVLKGKPTVEHPSF